MAIHHWRNLLSSAEQARAGRFRRPDDRDRWIVAHGVLRMILGRLAECAPEQIVFGEGENGKPHIVEPASAACWRINLSHSHRMCVIGTTKLAALGVDIEHVRSIEDMNGVARRVFTGREYGELTALQGEQRLRGFYNGWTRKEAIVKAMGVGISQSLQSIEVSLAPGDRPALRRCAEDDPAAWQLYSPAISAAYAAAVAIRSHTPIELEIRQYEAIS